MCAEGGPPERLAGADAHGNGKAPTGGVGAKHEAGVYALISRSGV